MRSTPQSYGLSTIPRHVAIIMDGNGRWAKERTFARIQGHRKGVESVRSAVRVSGEIGVQYLTLYAFSSENWSRPKPEIEALMKLLEEFLVKEIPELNDNNVQLHSIGQIDDLPARVQKQLEVSKKATAANTGLKLILALSYGSRPEIVKATRELAEQAASGKIKAAEIDEKMFGEHLYTKDYPDPDLLIRTSGEMRLSNFLLWQCSYAELVISPVFWPDFGKEQYLDAIREYGRRHRRFGGV